MQTAHTNGDSKRPRGARRKEKAMNNKDLTIGIGIGLAAGALGAMLMRPKKKDVKSAVARVIGDVADSVSKNMGW